MKFSYLDVLSSHVGWRKKTWYSLKKVIYLSNNTQIWAKIVLFWLFFNPKKSVEKSEKMEESEERGGKYKRAWEKVTYLLALYLPSRSFQWVESTSR